ncbi:MAG TPA: DUF1015 domain-containing protein [Terriglobales bacterium]|jgi:uncharacterized protein (DUF1015 family)|nr:DUF1015 domain-containing protein [Terriglobales bacterium]
MVRIAPFRGVFYNQKKIKDLSKVIAPPYDVISGEEQEKLQKKSPYNFVRLDLSQEPDAYNAVAQLLGDWQAQGIFERDETPAIYFLSHRFKLKSGEKKLRLGFFALTELQDPVSGNIRPHEKTLDAPKEDRLKLMLACHAQLSPIFALYAQGNHAINRMLALAVEGMAPFIEIAQDNGDELRLWRISEGALIQKVQAEMAPQSLLIADGHHRYEATLRYRDQMRAERGQANGIEAFNYIMTYFANMSDDNLVILPTHRLVRGYAHKPFLELEEALQSYFYVEQHPKTPEGKISFLKGLKTAAKKHHVIGASFKRDPRYLILRLKNKRIMQRLAKDLSGPLRELDVSTLHLLILDHILGLNPEQQVSGDTIRYSQDEETVLQALEKEDFQAAFILNASKAEEILAIVSAGEKMPQKSTYFYPKLPSGLIVNKIDPNEQIEAARAE